MKETVLDVLMYLFESFVDSEDEPEPNRNELRDELERAGFGDREIDGALEWLDALNASDVAPGTSAPSAGMRIYDTAELERLDAKTRGYLLHLEQLGILQPQQRELAIDRLLALDCEEIDIEQVKWVVMMVLFSQPGHEQAYSQMEDLVFAEEPGWMH
jgi:Smg protein